MCKGPRWTPHPGISWATGTGLKTLHTSQILPARVPHLSPGSSVFIEVGHVALWLTSVSRPSRSKGSQLTQDPTADLTVRRHWRASWGPPVSKGTLNRWDLPRV